MHVLSISAVSLVHLLVSHEGCKFLTSTRLYLFATNLMYSVNTVHTVSHVRINLSSSNQYSMLHISSRTSYHSDILIHIKEALKDKSNHAHILSSSISAVLPVGSRSVHCTKSVYTAKLLLKMGEKIVRNM
jgi:hypothetical protein